MKEIFIPPEIVHHPQFPIPLRTRLVIHYRRGTTTSIMMSEFKHDSVRLPSLARQRYHNRLWVISLVLSLSFVYFGITPESVILGLGADGSDFCTDAFKSEPETFNLSSRIED
jgi:hypothetical protein